MVFNFMQYSVSVQCLLMSNMKKNHSQLEHNYRENFSHLVLARLTDCRFHDSF